MAPRMAGFSASVDTSKIAKWGSFLVTPQYAQFPKLRYLQQSFNLSPHRGYFLPATHTANANWL